MEVTNINFEGVNYNEKRRIKLGQASCKKLGEL